jgi:hypothetical protein
MDALNLKATLAKHREGAAFPLFQEEIEQAQSKSL